MLVVPIDKDQIKTKDKQSYKVVSYTNYKDGGPAVYGKMRGDKSLTLIYFFDIAEINDVPVELVKGSKVFNALGKITRAQHLPQPDDKLIIGDEEKMVEVQGLKLKSKTVGPSKGLLVKDDNGDYYRLKQIKDIERNLHGDHFDREAFMHIYHDYLGV
jgi:hypothetical protein